ncbi:hypothetical protein HanPI659440_Chr13g0512711 [Helianthus annuus]|nr:hypothetical protein HanPI659440_Chr13g0512711 [Helianthus annuus]
MIGFKSNNFSTTNETTLESPSLNLHLRINGGKQIGSRQHKHGNRGLCSMDSMESHRWVFQDQEDSEIDFDDDNDDADFTLHIDLDSEDEDSLYQKLIRTGPRIDYFGVEALEVPGAHRSDFEELRCHEKASSWNNSVQVFPRKPIIITVGVKHPPPPNWFFCCSS